MRSARSHEGRAASPSRRGEAGQAGRSKPEEHLVGGQEGLASWLVGGVLLGAQEPAALVDGGARGGPGLLDQRRPGAIRRQVGQLAGGQGEVGQLEKRVELLVGAERGVAAAPVGMMAARPAAIGSLAAQEQPAQVIGDDGGVLVVAAARPGRQQQASLPPAVSRPGQRQDAMVRQQATLARSHLERRAGPHVGGRPVVQLPDAAHEPGRDTQWSGLGDRAWVRR